jgi:hypothetical protein
MACAAEFHNTRLAWRYYGRFGPFANAISTDLILIISEKTTTKQ